MYTTYVQNFSLFNSFKNRFDNQLLTDFFSNIANYPSDYVLCKKFSTHCKSMLAQGRIYDLLEYYLFLIRWSNGEDNKLSFKSIFGNMCFLNKPFNIQLDLFEAYINNSPDEDKSEIDITSEFISEVIFKTPRPDVVTDEYIRDLYQRINDDYIEVQTKNNDIASLHDFFVRESKLFEKKVKFLNKTDDFKNNKNIDYNQVCDYYNNIQKLFQYLISEPNNQKCFCNLIDTLVQLEKQYGRYLKYEKIDTFNIRNSCVLYYSKYYLESQIFALNSLLDCLLKHSTTNSFHLTSIFTNYINKLIDSVSFYKHFYEANGIIESVLNILNDFFNWSVILSEDCNSRSCNTEYLYNCFLHKDHKAIFMTNRNISDNIGEDIYKFLSKYKNTIFMDRMLKDRPDGFGSFILCGAIDLYNNRKIKQVVDLFLDYKDVFLPVDSFSSGLFRSEPYRYVLVKCFYENSDFEKAIQLYDLIIYGKNYDKIYGLDTKLFYDFAESSIYEHFAQLVLNITNSVFRTIETIKESSNNDEETTIRNIQKEYEPLKKIIPYLAKSTVFFDEEIKRNAESFLKLISDTDMSYEFLTNKISVKDWNTMKQYIRQGNILFDFISSLYQNNWSNSKLDYSPALLEMTKALEYFLNLVFNKIKSNDFGDAFFRKDIDKYYFDGKKYKEAIEFGPCAFLFEKDRFDRVLHKIFDKEKLEKIWDDLSVIKFPCYDKDRKSAIDFSFRLNRNNETELLFQALLRIKGLRNQAAHKKGVTYSDYEECKKYMLTTQYVLWILLYILKENTLK